MNTENDLDAFIDVGLDAVIYPPWPTQLEGDNWRVTKTVQERDEDSREITLQIETPGGILTQTSVGTVYTNTETHHLVKKEEDIFLI